MTSAYLFIGADPTINAGEADYFHALALAARSLPADACFAVRLGGVKTDTIATLADARRNYEALPAAQLAHIPATTTDLHIIACGFSTIDVAQKIAARLGGNAQVHYITFMLPENSAQILAQTNTTVYAPVGRAPSGVNLVTLPAVPHTNTHAAAQGALDIFTTRNHAQEFMQHVDAGDDFVCAVVNAGFADANGVHQPYTRDEAAAHGYALGSHQAAGTHVLLMHGGPRNLKDEALGHDTFDAFAQGYLDAQREKGARPFIQRERYSPSTSYNIIKASYALAHRPNCTAFISNAEGYGTLDGALNLTPQSCFVGMFPFAAEDSDSTGQRRANTARYATQGVHCLSADDDGALHIAPTPPRDMPAPSDPAATIIGAIAASSAAPALHRRAAAPALRR